MVVFLSWNFFLLLYFFLLLLGFLVAKSHFFDVIGHKYTDLTKSKWSTIDKIKILIYKKIEIQ